MYGYNTRHDLRLVVQKGTSRSELVHCMRRVSSKKGDASQALRFGARVR